MQIQKSSGSTVHKPLSFSGIFLLYQNKSWLVSYISVPKEEKKDEPPPKKKKKEPQPTLLEEIEKELSKEIPREPPEVINPSSLFTLDFCVCVNVKVWYCVDSNANVDAENGFKHILCICITIDAVFSFGGDVDANADKYEPLNY